MSQENVEMGNQAVDAFNRGDLGDRVVARFIWRAVGSGLA